MARQLVGSGAFATSLVVHALLLGAGALVLTRSLAERAREPAKTALATPPEEVEIDVAPTRGASESTPSRDDPAPPRRVSTPPPPGGGPPERHPDTEHAGRGGSRTAEQAAVNLASHVDPITLEPNPITHLDRSQVSRLHTAQERRSWDDHRSTPNPMELTFVATGHGSVEERREPGISTRGSIAGAVPAPAGGNVGSEPSEVALDSAVAAGTEFAGVREPQTQRGALTAAPNNGRSARAEVLLARPLVMRARPALPTETRARPNDTENSSDAVASRVAALIHASTVGGPQGPGVGGEPIGGRPGRSGEEGIGSRAAPSGFGPGADTSNDPGVRRYEADMRRRIEDQLRRAFPDWAIEAGRGGRVIFEFALLADGRVESVRLVRASGIEEYDGNVLAGMRRIQSFGPLPKAFGTALLVTMTYDTRNPAVGRDGAGPGGYGAHRTP